MVAPKEKKWLKDCPCGEVFFGTQHRVYCSTPCKSKYGSRENNKRRYQSLKRFLIAVKETCGCVDCGIRDIRVLHFDHLRDKKFKVASAVSIAYAIPELEKCEVVCANCHAIRTWERLSADS